MCKTFVNLKKMIQKLWLLFAFISNIGFAQTYDFNLVTIYTNSREGISTDRIVFSNTDNQTYFMSIANNSDKNVAYLVDIKNSKNHYISYVKEMVDGETSFEFSYNKTTPVEQVELTNDNYFEFETIQEDSIYKTIRMTCVKKKKKKSDTSITLIKVKKIKYNLFPIFRFSHLHLFEYREDVDLNENGIVESAESLNYPKNTCKLTYFKDVNFKVYIPNNKKLRL